MTFFSFTYYQFKKLIIYFILLLILFIFNFYYNLNFHWSGVQVIVRIYLFVFSFFLIYNYSMDEKLFLENYKNRYGFKGILLFIFESRFLLFSLILFFAAIYRLTTYSGSTFWPNKYLLSLLDGRDFDVLYFGLAFFIALKLVKFPLFTVSIFLAISFSYTFLNLKFYQIFEAGKIISIYKITKLFIFIYIINFSYCKKIRHHIALSIVSIFSSLMLYSFSFGTFYYIHKNYPINSRMYNYSIEKLIKFGYKEPIFEMISEVRKTYNIEYLIKLDSYANFYDFNFVLNYDICRNILLKNNDTKKINILSKILLKQCKKFNYEDVEKSLSTRLKMKEEILNQKEYIKLCASSLDDDNYQMFLDSFINIDENTTLFVVKTTGKSKNPVFIPTLLDLLLSVNEEISISAYNSLKEISNLDPVKQSGFDRNSVETYSIFKNFYLRNSNHSE